MKKLIALFVCQITVVTSFAQIVSIPDANFKASLLADPLINTNADTEIQLSEANAFTGGIGVGYHSISDLTGISSFVNLTILNCPGNQLTSLDLSANTALTALDCAVNQLTSLDLSANTALTQLSCGQNQLTSLNVSNNVALVTLVCNFNQITSLDVKAHHALKNLNFMVNQLTSIDVSGDTSLMYLYCNDNQLNSINLNGVSGLIALICNNNNGYTHLDVSGLPALNYLYCGNCPNLQCIQVSNVSSAYSNPNWNKDSTATYSLNCATDVSNAALEDFNLYPNPVKNNVNITGLYKNEVWQLFNIYGQSVLSGICSNDYPISLDFQKFNPGIYTFHFTRNNTNYIRRFVKDAD